MRHPPRSSSSILPATAAITVDLIAVVAWSATSIVDVRTVANGANSHLSFDSGTTNVLPNIAQIVNFTITQNTSGDTGPFNVAPTDTLVVFVELFGRTTVNNVTIENGPNDTFVQEASLLDYVNGGTHGFSIWACANVDGGANTDVNVTLTGGTTDSAAIEVVDVNGGNPYGGNPIPFVDQVASIEHGVSHTPNEGLTVHADDLALAGIGTWSWNNVTTGGVSQLGDQVTTNSTVTGTNVTAAVLYYSNANSTAKTINMNGTLETSAPWIIDIITVGATDYTTTYAVAFSETGLPSGTAWCQTIQTVGPPQCGTAGSTWLAQNGTYDWNISVESDTNYFDPILGNSGSLTVKGSALTMAFNFTDPLPCGYSTYPACIQHVVIIVLENEPLSAVMASGNSNGGDTEKWLAKTYMGASNFYAACHPSAPNYLALISANTDQCGTDSYNDWKDITLADTLTNNAQYTTGGQAFTWANYAEDLPSNACSSPSTYSGIQPGVTTGTALFFSKHVPFLYEQDTTSQSSYCTSHILSLEPGAYDTTTSTFNGSVAGGTMPTLSFITPNACDDGHDLCESPTAYHTGPSATCYDSLMTGGGSSCVAVTNTNPTQSKQAISGQIDLWLRNYIGPLINCTGPYASGTAHMNCLGELQHTAIFILYDEGLGSPTTRSTGGPKYAGETTNNNVQFCNYGNFPKTFRESVCGNKIYEVTVIPNPGNGRGYKLAAGSGKSFFSHTTSDYSITSTIEWLFGLASFQTVHNEGYLSGYSYSTLDTFWAMEDLNLGGSSGETPHDEFAFPENGY